MKAILGSIVIALIVILISNINWKNTWIRTQEIFGEIFIQPFCKHDFGEREGIARNGKDIFICAKCNKYIEK